MTKSYTRFTFIFFIYQMKTSIASFMLVFPFINCSSSQLYNSFYPPSTIWPHIRHTSFYNDDKSCNISLNVSHATNPLIVKRLNRFKLAIEIHSTTVLLITISFASVYIIGFLTIVTNIGVCRN